MIENTLQGRGEWPMNPQRARKRRDSRAAYYNSRYPHRTFPASSSPSSPLGISSSRPQVTIHQQTTPGDLGHLEYLDFFNFHDPSAPGFESSVHQDFQAETPWLPSPMVSYTLPSRAPNSPLSADQNSSSLQEELSSPTIGDNIRIVWQTGPTTTGDFISDADVMSDSQCGSYESFNNMALTMPNTTSSISDSYICAGANSGFDSPRTSSQLRNLSLSEEGYFQPGHSLDFSYCPSGQPVSPQYADVFPFENDSMGADWSGAGDIYMTQSWSAMTLTQPQQVRDTWSPTAVTYPWNLEQLENNGPDAVHLAFETNHDSQHDTFKERKDSSDTGQSVGEEFDREAVSPDLEGESEEWQLVPSYANSAFASHDSPQSEGSSWSHISSSPQSLSSSGHQGEHPSHIYSTFKGLPNPKLPRGRQRALTSQEKQEALDVRKAKACWACHLSKIKCSPCSPGSPCQQCERLTGKRRFCLLPCFNDSLESLQTFIVPEYLVGEFTQATVEKWVSQNTSGWGTHQIRVRMGWGYWKPLEASVVTLAMPSNSRLRYHAQTDSNGTSRPTLVRQKSPPLGIPFDAMDGMQEEYRNLVYEIVTTDLAKYVPIAYDPGVVLPERILGAICSFYSAGLAAGQECELLREAIEIHITSTVLERSLLLDEASMYQVQDYLQQQYPPRSAAKCAQRQIKLAFFIVQQKRISDVLRNWGVLMWSSNKSMSNEQKWAVSFSVLLILILVMDKTLESAYYFSESMIKHHSFDEKSEKAEFHQLVELTQTVLFERCKEIFHSSFKTRKGGKEACNPIRDGIRAFRGRPVNEGISRLVWDLEALIREFEPEVRSHRESKPASSDGYPYTNPGRLGSIFLADFLDY